MPLEKARSVAQAVAHRRGGTDQALARLDKEINRYNKAEVAVDELLGADGEESGAMPDELWEKIAGNRELTERAIRLSIIVHQRGLREKINAIFAKDQ